MCHSSKEGCCKEGVCGGCKKGGCSANLIAKILVIIGGVNWGLIGLGMLWGGVSSWNLVNLVLGSMPALEGIVYVLVGIAAVVMIFGCKCKRCKGGECKDGECKAEGEVAPIAETTEKTM